IGSTLVQLLPHREAGDAWSLTLNAGLATGIMSGLLTGSMVVVVLPLFSHQFDIVEHNTAFTLVLVVGVPLMTVSLLLDQAFMAERAAHNMFVRNAAVAVLKILLLVLPVVLVTQVGALGILLSWVLSMAVGLVGGLLLVLRLGRAYYPAVCGIVGQVRSMLSSLVGHHFINLGGFVPMYLLPVFVTIQLSPTDNAYFYTADRLGSFFFMVSSAVALSLFAEGSQAADDLPRKIRSSVAISGILLCPAMLICFLGGHYILLLFGPNYAQHSLPLLRIYVLSAVPDAFTSIYVSVLRVEKRLRFAALLNLGMAALTLALAWIMLPEFGIAGAGWAWLVAQVFGSLLAGVDCICCCCHRSGVSGSAYRGLKLYRIGRHRSAEKRTSQGD
ncbi:MAG TPA: polysaccharide biosynthesis C-terminal domain-containing protein, partial [Ktedonobacteraceae bacterium]